MGTLSYSVADSQFNDGEVAQGTEVRTRFADITTFLNNNNVDGTNLNLGAVLAWTSRHSWAVNSATNDNLALSVNAVLNASIYGLKITSTQAQTNSQLMLVDQDNASSTASAARIKNDGTGSCLEVEQIGVGSAIKSTVTGTSNTGKGVEVVNAGIGNSFETTLRTLSGLSATLLSKVATTTTTVDNTATETAFADLTTTLPANFLKAGTTIRGKVFGTVDTPGAAPATMRVLVRYGGTSGTILLDSGAITPNVDLVDSQLEVDFQVTCRTVGATGTVFAQGNTKWNSNTIPDSRGMGTAGTGAGNGATVTVDTTGANALVVDFVWGSAVAGCTANLQVGSLEILK